MLERLVELGQLRADGDGLFDARDVAIVSTVRALQGSGVGDDDLVWLVAGRRRRVRGRRADVRDAGSPQRPDVPRVHRRARTAGRRLPGVYAGFGLSEPEPDRPMREDEVSILLRFLRTWDAVDPGGDADLRVARLSGETSRRMMEGWLDVWDATAQPELATQGAPRRRGRPVDPATRSRTPRSAVPPSSASCSAWLQERHLERTLNQRIIEATESALVRAGRLPARPTLPTAIAFVDLTGYTSLTERLGDEAAALAAARLAALADECARQHGGRVVKLLGDGVLLRFEDPPTAVLAVATCSRRSTPPASRRGMPGSRPAGSSPADGDIYGRTVNLAARIASQADPGQLLVDEGVVGALPDGPGSRRSARSASRGSPNRSSCGPSRPRARPRPGRGVARRAGG